MTEQTYMTASKPGISQHIQYIANLGHRLPYYYITELYAIAESGHVTRYLLHYHGHGAQVTEVVHVNIALVLENKLLNISSKGSDMS